MDQFELIDDLEAYLRTIEEGVPQDDDAVDYNHYPHCMVPMMVKTNNQYVCAQCGLLNERVEVTDMSAIPSDMNNNTIASGLRCVESNAHRYQTILRSQSSCEASPEMHVRNIMFTINHKIGKDGAVPKNILLNVCEQFKQIREEGTIYRGTILRAIQAAMTYYECLRHRLP